MQVWDFDVAVRAQKEPVPCSTAVFSLAHLAPETISDKHVTKVSFLPSFVRLQGVALRACCYLIRLDFPLGSNWVSMYAHACLDEHVHSSA